MSAIPNHVISDLDLKRLQKLKEMREASRAAAEARKAAGVKVVPLNPYQKLESKPHSMKNMIRLACYQCVGEDTDAGWKQRVRECEHKRCGLFNGRPYK